MILFDKSVWINNELLIKHDYFRSTIVCTELIDYIQIKLPN